MTKKSKKIVRFYYQEIFPIILIFLIGIISILVFNSRELVKQSINGPTINLDTGWELITDTKNEPVVFPLKVKIKQDQGKKLVYVVNDEMDNFPNLALKIYDYYYGLKLDINNVSLYESNLSGNWISDLNGTEDIVIPLNNIQKGDIITITLIGKVYGNFTYIIPNIVMGDEVNLKYQMFAQVPISFYFNIILIAVGLIIFIISFVMRNEENAIHLLNIGIFSFLSGVGLLFSLRWFGNVAGNPFLIYIIGYLSLLLVAWPILIEIIESSFGFVNKFTNIALIYGVALFFITTFLNFVFKIDYPTMIMFIHFEFLLTLIAVIMNGVIAKKENNIKGMELSKSLVVLGILLVVDLIRFYVNKNPDNYTTYIEIGVFISICFQMFYTYKDYNKKIKERYLANIYRRLAFTDALTGLKSRVAYSRDILDIEENRNLYKSIFVVSIDLNNLKYNNDNFGHAKGDTLLQTAAKLFSNVIKESDSLYRVGGDEFIIFLKNYNDEEVVDFKQRLENMRLMVNKNNKLDIEFAIGFCKFDTKKSGTFEEAIIESDLQMYLCKNEMKQKGVKD